MSTPTIAVPVELLELLTDAAENGTGIGTPELMQALALLATRPAEQPWTELAAAMYQAAGAFDLPERVLNLLSAAANGEPFAHLIDVLPCVPEQPSAAQVPGVYEVEIPTIVAVVLTETQMGIGYDRRIGPVLWIGPPPQGEHLMTVSQHRRIIAAAPNASEGREVVPLPDVDDLANFIRHTDGNHRMGTGALAERIVDWLSAPDAALSAAQVGGGDGR